MVTKFIITEGVAGHWYYHISKECCFSRALCGAQTTHTYLPLTSWGIGTHLNERYCKKCHDKMEQLKVLR